MVQAFQTIISRNKKPIDAGVISVTMIHAGEATNVVPDSCELQGTVRTFTFEVLDLIEQRMKQVAEHTCAAHGAQCEFEFQRNYPPTINHPRRAEFARKVMASIVGADNVDVQEPTMGAEDFSLHAAGQARCLLLHRQRRRRAPREMGHGGGPCMLHNPSYDFNDDLIPLGATYWVRLAEEWLARSAHDRRHAGLLPHLRAGAVKFLEAAATAGLQVESHRAPLKRAATARRWPWTWCWTARPTRASC
jgi:metal-dependent amidase/aminoacylase/carboxypeptidase family protein